MRFTVLRGAIVALGLLTASSASAVSMAWTPIGNPGNAPAPNTDCADYPGPYYGYSHACGGVPYTYNIGTYEVSNAQYTEFLNAKAASDPLGLYNTSMGTSIYGGITRTGISGSYSYSAIAGREDKPVNMVSFFDVLRFANWLNNGQGAGDTETGSYTLLGGTATPSNDRTVTRNVGATIVLTNEDEWYKAAYYDPSTANYFAYPFASDTQSTCTTPTATPNSANCYYAGGSAPTTVGSYTGSASPYGTFDQGGNVWEWNEAKIAGDRGLRGGSFDTAPDHLAASFRSSTGATYEVGSFGFRLAMIPGGYVPEPSTGLLVVAGLLGLASWRRARA
jgi:hypothetical protein